MAHVLYLNYTKAEEGLEEKVFGDFAKPTFYKGPGVPTDLPPVDECLRAEGIISGAAQHDVGPIDQYPHCKIIVRLGVGYDNLDVKAWSARAWMFYRRSPRPRCLLCWRTGRQARHG